MGDDEGWAEPDDQMGLWEHQGRPLTVKLLLQALATLHPDVVLTIEHYDGAGGTKHLRPMHVDLRIRPHPGEAVITVVD